MINDDLEIHNHQNFFDLFVFSHYRKPVEMSQTPISSSQIRQFVTILSNGVRGKDLYRGSPHEDLSQLALDLSISLLAKYSQLPDLVQEFDKKFNVDLDRFNKKQEQLYRSRPVEAGVIEQPIIKKDEIKLKEKDSVKSEKANKEGNTFEQNNLNQNRHSNDEAGQTFKPIDPEALKKITFNNGNLFLFCLTHNPSFSQTTSVIGQENCKSAIKYGFIYPFLFSNLFKKAKVLLLYGPPGTGKTEVARAIPNEMKIVDLTYFSENGASLKSKWMGGTEKNIRNLFQTAEKYAVDIREKCLEDKVDKVSKCKTASMIFLDEVEAIAVDRQTQNDVASVASTNALLTEMDGLVSYNNIMMILATNEPWKLDNAIQRRCDKTVFVDLPKKDDFFIKIRDRIIEKFAHVYLVDENGVERKHQFTEMVNILSIQENVQDRTGQKDLIEERKLNIAKSLFQKMMQYSKFREFIGFIAKDASKDDIYNAVKKAFQNKIVPYFTWNDGAFQKLNDKDFEVAEKKWEVYLRGYIPYKETKGNKIFDDSKLNAREAEKSSENKRARFGYSLSDVDKIMDIVFRTIPESFFNKTLSCKISQKEFSLRDISTYKNKDGTEKITNKLKKKTLFLMEENPFILNPVTNEKEYEQKDILIEYEQGDNFVTFMLNPQDIIDKTLEYNSSVRPIDYTRLLYYSIFNTVIPITSNIIKNIATA